MTLSRLLAWLLALRFAPLPVRTRAVVEALSPYAAPGRCMAAYAPTPYCLAGALTRGAAACSRLRVSSLAGLRAPSGDASTDCSWRWSAGRASRRPRASSGPADERQCPLLTRRACAGISPFARLGPSTSHRWLLWHPAKISPGPCDLADGVEAGLPTGWAGLVPRRRLGQRRNKADFAKACARRLQGPGAS